MVPPSAVQPPDVAEAPGVPGVPGAPEAPEAPKPLAVALGAALQPAEVQPPRAAPLPLPHYRSP